MSSSSPSSRRIFFLGTITIGPGLDLRHNPRQGLHSCPLPQSLFIAGRDCLRFHGESFPWKSKSFSSFALFVIFVAALCCIFTANLFLGNVSSFVFFVFFVRFLTASLRRRKSHNRPRLRYTTQSFTRSGSCPLPQSSLLAGSESSLFSRRVVSFQLETVHVFLSILVRRICFYVPRQISSQEASRRSSVSSSSSSSLSRRIFFLGTITIGPGLYLQHNP